LRKKNKAAPKPFEHLNLFDSQTNFGLIEILRPKMTAARLKTELLKKYFDS